MKFLFAFLLTALLSFIGALYFPWWIIAPVAFAVALLIPESAWRSWLAAFLGVFLLWGGLAWWIDIKNASILSTRIGHLLGTGTNSFLLILITGIIGGLVAGFAALSAHYVKRPVG